MSRGTAIGDHPLQFGPIYTGLIYEPRISLGALTPAQFTFGTAVDIPEPATMALLGLAAAGLGGYLRRRRAA